MISRLNSFLLDDPSQSALALILRHSVSRTGALVFRMTLLTILLLGVAGPAQAQHSDIVLSRSSGVLRVDSTLHTGDVRENDANGDGTVWATDNPGFAGSGFVFQDEFLFDITGPLKRWDGTNYSTANVGPQFMEFVEPGPFGDPLHSVTITRGSLHTHFVSSRCAAGGVVPLSRWPASGANSAQRLAA